MAEWLEGLVVKSTGSWYRVELKSGKIIDCTIRGNLRIRDIRSTNPVAVGDIVRINPEDQEGVSQIIEVVDRKNYLIRRSSNLSKQIQIIASNLDQILLVVTMVMPETKTEFLDRFLATAEAYRIPVVLVYNKIDLYNKDISAFMEEQISCYQQIGYPCFRISALQKNGLEDLKTELQNKTTLVSGNSGVGKSTLLNSIKPDLSLRTASISDYHKKGKHTTTFAEAFALDDGGYIIDTPGIKGFGTYDMHKNEIFHFFREIFIVSAKCRFNNCVHIQEPGCAVIQAVDSGEIHPSRYRSYLGMYYEGEGKYRGKD